MVLYGVGLIWTVGGCFRAALGGVGDIGCSWVVSWVGLDGIECMVSGVPLVTGGVSPHLPLPEGHELATARHVHENT